MKAMDRCKEHRQGDRCRKEKGHASVVHPERDTLHVGSHSAWGEGRETYVTTLKGKRNRKLSRFANIDHRTVDKRNWQVVKAMLGEAVKHFRGAK